jgi:hypothetical protein
MRIVINLDRGVLIAKVARTGARIPLLRLGAITGGVQALPGLLLLKDVNLSLTAPGTQTLNQKFDTALFEAGLPFGKATVVASRARGALRARGEPLCLEAGVLWLSSGLAFLPCGEAPREPIQKVEG